MRLVIGRQFLPLRMWPYTYLTPGRFYRMRSGNVNPRYSILHTILPLVTHFPFRRSKISHSGNLETVWNEFPSQASSPSALEIFDVKKLLLICFPQVLTYQLNGHMHMGSN